MTHANKTAPQQLKLPGIVEPIGLVASVITLIYGLLDILGIFGDKTANIERVLIVTIYTILFVYFLYRVIRSLRSERYRQTLPLQHKFNHYIRDFYDVVHSHLSTIDYIHRKKGSFSELERQKLIRELEDADRQASILLKAAIQEIESCFWHVSAKRVCVCLRYMAISDTQSGRVVARTLFRDSHSASSLKAFDKKVLEHDLDALSGNDHFKALFESDDSRWVIRFESRKHADKEMPHKGVRHGYELAKMKIPTESLLMASISLIPSKWEGSDAARSKPVAETQAWEVHSNHKMGRGQDVGADAGSARTVGILIVESPSKKAFHRSDEELIFAYSDALYWPITLYNRLNFAKISLDNYVATEE